MRETLVWWCLGSALVAFLCLAWSPKRFRASLVRPLVTGVCLSIALITGVLAAALHTYAALTVEEPVATIRCESLSPSPPRFRLHYAPHQPPGAPQAFELAGDQWMVSGEILKWHPWLTVLGFRTVHKPTRLNGRFADAAKERAQPPTVYDLNRGTNAVWQWLHRHGARFPFVEAVYGNGVYTYAQPGRTYTLYVTPSGYIAK